MLALLTANDFLCFASGTFPGHEDCQWALVRLVTRSKGAGEAWDSSIAEIRKADGLLKPLGWELGNVLTVPYISKDRREVVWTIEPFDQRSGT